GARRRLGVGRPARRAGRPRGAGGRGVGQQRRPRPARPPARGGAGGAGRRPVRRRARDRRRRRAREALRGPLPRRRRGGVRAQPHPVGHPGPAPPAQPRLPDRPPPAADVHVDDGDGGRRHPDRGDPAPPPPL
ncbi:MAG: Phosphoesterase, partial [uncultured Pseudonocardia sp.]